MSTRPRARQACLRAVRVLALGLLPLLAAAAPGALPGGPAGPYTPRDDDERIERLPVRLGAPSRELRTLLARQPDHLPLALQVAREALVRARVHGDPRELGTVQAALAPWWALAEPPAPVRLLRAAVLQTRHDFAAALADLDTLLAQPALPPALQAQALLDRAAVLQVQGRFDEAARDCTTLARGPAAALGAAVTLPARACLAELKSLRGQPAEAATELAALARQPGAGGWLALVRAELAVRQGDARTAEQQFRAALAQQQDVYTQAAWADWLLDQGRAGEVLSLWPADETPQADALLLRRVLALRQLGDARAAPQAQELAARFEASRLRGDPPHAREEALLLLALGSDLPRALQLAQAQWAQQKEPADALLLVRAAHAAGRPEAAEPVRRFVQQTGLTDVRLARANRPGAQ